MKFITISGAVNPALNGRISGIFNDDPEDAYEFVFTPEEIQSNLTEEQAIQLYETKYANQTPL
jgi:hypothetical protein